VSLPNATELEQRVRDLMAAWRVADPDVEVRWNERLQTAAGRAFVRSGRIELNPMLLGRAPEQLPMVLAHEAARTMPARPVFVSAYETEKLTFAGPVSAVRNR
jgi:predicted SprT family Zn-dependent metalloprotease